MKSFEELQEYFDETVKADLLELEERRLKMHRTRLLLGALNALVVLLNASMILLGEFHPLTLVFSMVLVPFIFFYIYKFGYHDHTLVETYKREIVARLLEFIDPSLTYSPEEHVPFQDFHESGFFPLRPDHFSGDDLITGQVDGIPIVFSELEVSYKKNLSPKENEKHSGRGWHTLFHGLFLKAEYPEDLGVHMYILPDTLQYYFGQAGRTLQRNTLYYGTHVPVRNPDFSEQFVVYADQPALAERLLTTELLNKMMLLHQKGNCKVYAAFIREHIYVAVDLRREIFEVDTTRPLYSKYFIRNFYEEILYIFSVIEDLNIDEMEFPEQED